MGGLLLIEIMDILADYRVYFHSMWNWIDVVLYVSWYSFYIIKWCSGFKSTIITDLEKHSYTNDMILMNILKVFVITVSFAKIMSYCRAFEGFASLI